MEKHFSIARLCFMALFSAMVLVQGISSPAQATPYSPAEAAATRGKPVARIDWGIWVDPDGCMHWWADGGLEGYMIDRVNPKNGKPVCLKQNTCLVENTDTLFETDSATLTPEARQRLNRFFQSIDVFGVAVYGHTDSRASYSHNQRLSERRAASVAAVAKANGVVVERQIGFGETAPVATNSTAAGMQQNRRVEVICYGW